MRLASSVVTACLIVACAASSPSVGGGSRDPTTEALASSTYEASTTASAAAATPTGPARYQGSDTPLRSGTYQTTQFRYPFSADIDTDLGLRDADDLESFVYIGQDKNAAENADEEFTVMFIVHVLDPGDQRSLMPLEGDVYDWFISHPRLAPVAGSDRQLQVGGFPARQIDLRLSEPVACGATHPNLRCVLIGYGPPGDEPFAVFEGNRLRIVVVDHEEEPIVFSYQSTDDEAFARRAGVFDRWVGSVDFE